MPDIWWYEKRKSWCADVPDSEEPGKRRRLYLGADEDEARRQLHQYLADYYAHKHPSTRQGQPLSLYALAARFWKWSETNLSASSQDIYKRQLRPFVQKHGRRAAADITPTDIEAHKADIKQRGCKPRTVNFFVQSIKRMYSWGVEQGLIAGTCLACKGGTVR